MTDSIQPAYYTEIPIDGDPVDAILGLIKQHEDSPVQPLPTGPRIVCICGSTRFMAEMAEENLRQTAAGHIVVAPGCDMKTPHPLWADPADAEALKVRLDALHKAKIRLADVVVIVAPGGYIGDSTRSEIAYAREHGKPVVYSPPKPEHDFEPTEVAFLCECGDHLFARSHGGALDI